MGLLTDILNEIQLVFQQGGLVLWIMVILSVILYSLIFSTWVGMHKVREEIGELDENHLNSSYVKVLQGEVGIFALTRLAWVQRRLPMISVLIATAPLAGLLGTIFGMFVSFNSMATQVSVQQIDNVSLGISAAMITTQAGLFMAIPGAILLAILRGQAKGVERDLEQKMYQHMRELKGGLA